MQSHLTDPFHLFDLATFVRALRILGLGRLNHNTVLALSYLVQFELEYEARPFAFFRGERDSAFELLHDLFGDHQTQADPVNVHLLVVLNEPEKLEEFVLVLLRDADAGVDNFHLQEFVLRDLVKNYLDGCLYEPGLCELYSVGLEPYENLHDPLFVTANQGVVSLNGAHFLDADKLGVEIKIFVLGFLFLHLHDFVYRVSNIKNFVVLPELTDFDLRVVQQILDYEIHKLS